MRRGMRIVDLSNDLDLRLPAQNCTQSCADEGARADDQNADRCVHDSPLDLSTCSSRVE